MAAREIDPVQSQPHTGLERVEDMCLHGIDRRLRESIAAEEVSVVAEECHAWGDFECPGTPSLGNSQFGLKRPAIVAEVEQLGRLIDRLQEQKRYPRVGRSWIARAAPLRSVKVTCPLGQWP